MGLIGEVLLLPFAPVRGSAWVIGQVLAEAERRYCDPAVVRAELAALEERLTTGEIDEEEFGAREDELLDRLETSLRAGYGEIRGHADAVAEWGEEAYEGEGGDEGEENGEYPDGDAEEPDPGGEARYAGGGSRR